MRYLGGVAILSVLFVWIQGSGCGPEEACEDVNVNEVFISAFRSPETFDANHSSLQVHVGASQCLRDFAQEAFQAENEKLVECGQLISRSSAWNACHEEAEQHGLRGTILNDIAAALDGSRRFDASAGGTQLIFVKEALGAAEYEAFIDAVTANLASLNCEVCQ